MSSFRLGWGASIWLSTAATGWGPFWRGRQRVAARPAAAAGGWLGWRIAFGLGALFGGAMIIARRYVPESPRWLLVHGRAGERERSWPDRKPRARPQVPPAVHKRLQIRKSEQPGFGRILRTLVVDYPGRCVLGLA